MEPDSADLSLAAPASGCWILGHNRDLFPSQPRCPTNVNSLSSSPLYRRHEGGKTGPKSRRDLAAGKPCE